MLKPPQGQKATVFQRVSELVSKWPRKKCTHIHTHRHFRIDISRDIPIFNLHSSSAISTSLYILIPMGVLLFIVFSVCIGLICDRNCHTDHHDVTSRHSIRHQDDQSQSRKYSTGDPGESEELQVRSIPDNK